MQELKSQWFQVVGVAYGASVTCPNRQGKAHSLRQYPGRSLNILNILVTKVMCSQIHWNLCKQFLPRQ